MAFTLKDADAYFKAGVHPASAVWHNLSANERNAGLAYARKQLEWMMNDTLSTPSATADNTDVREDYALYEQAFYVATSNPYRSNAENTGVAFDATDASGNSASAELSMDSICRRARRWLRWSPHRVVRG